MKKKGGAKRLWIHLMVLVTTILATASGLANPVLDNVAAGQATVQQTPGSTVVNQASPKAILNWQSFNIGAAEKTHFQQPTGGVALNRISPNQGASQIFGQLTATGKIILVNQAGIFFGPTAHVDVGGIIASTSDISDANFLAGKYKFDQPSPYNGSIINQGTIHAAQNGLVALIGTGVRNDGTIEAHGGNVVLASGNKFTLDLSGDGLVNFTVDEAGTSAGVDQNGHALRSGVSNGRHGVILADGGTIIMTAREARGVVDQAINMKGVAVAHSVSSRNGVIILDGGDGNVRVSGKLDTSGKTAGTTGGTIKILARNIHVKPHAVIDVSGDAGGGDVLVSSTQSTRVDQGAAILADAISNGNGGHVKVWSDNDTAFNGSIFAQGGVNSGDGGFVETSGQYLNVANAKINLLAPAGITGTWLLDPENLTIQTAGPTTASFASNTFTGNVDDSILTVTDLQNALATASITVVTGSGGSQAGDITIANSVTWSTPNKLTISAFHNITINSGVTLSNVSGGSITLQANNKAAFAVGSGDGIVTNNGTLLISGAGGRVVVYYTPISYTTPVSYTNTGTALLTAYMLVNGVNDLQNLNLNPGGSYALNQRIDATATSGWNSGAGFLPIGSSGTPFTGILEGNNHTIVNLAINRPLVDDVGLFGATSNATIVDLGLINPVISGHQNVGSVAGLFSGASGALNIAFVSGGSVSGTSNVGGLIGNIQAGTVSNLANISTNVSASSTVAGGLVGLNQGAIQTSYSQGYVTAGSNAGGLVGSNSGTVTSSYWDTQTSGQSGNTGGTGELTVALQAALPGGFSSSIWHIVAGTSYPYLTNFNSGIPRIFSGTAPVSGGNTLVLANNGSQIDSTNTGANSYFYFQERNGTIDNGLPYLIYLDGASTVANVLGLTASGGGSTTSLSLIANAIQAATGSSGFSTTDMATAAGALSDSDILYSVSGSNLTLGNVTNPNVTLQTAGTGIFTINHIISSNGTTTNLNLNTPVAINTTGITTPGAQIYNNAVTLGAGSLTTLTSSNGAGMTFGSTVDGPQGLSIGNGSGNVTFGGVVGGTTLASLLIGTGDTTTLNTNSVTTSGSQTYNSALTLGASGLTTFTSDAGNISLNSTLTGGTRSLTLAGGAGGNHQFALTDVISIGTLTLNGNASVSNTIDFSGYVVPVVLTLSPPSGNVLDSGSLVTNTSSPIASFNTIQTAIGTNTGQSILVLPDVSGISVTYTNLAHTSGVISDPFTFIHFVIANPPASTPTPEPGPGPVDLNNLISGTTAFIVDNKNMEIINDGLDEYYDYFANAPWVDQNITALIKQQDAMNQYQTTKLTCYSVSIKDPALKDCRIYLVGQVGEF